jgi:hypothetical protein
MIEVLQNCEEDKERKTACYSSPQNLGPKRGLKYFFLNDKYPRGVTQVHL